jgi:tRNA threonylcarbamoyl adenosine modification protein YeaZ
VFLAIDTSAGTSVAVVGGGAVLAESSTADTMRHAEVVGDLLAGTLASAGIAPRDLEGVIAGMGPGPFTGLRVGIAAARAFAFGIGRPLLPAVSHDGVAFAAWRRGARGSLVVVTDARRREVYWSAYELSDEAPVRADGPGLCPPGEVPYPAAARIDAAEVGAADLAQVALLHRALGYGDEWNVPLYLRSPDVTMPGVRKRAS